MLRPTPSIQVELQDLGAPSVKKTSWRGRGLERSRRMGSASYLTSLPDELRFLLFCFARKYIFVRSFVSLLKWTLKKVNRVVRYIF